MVVCFRFLNTAMLTSPNTVKDCRSCKISKSLSEFYKKKGSKDGHENSCILCRRSRMKEVDKNRYNSLTRRENHLINTYVITQAVYQHLLLMQGGVCAVCGSESNGRVNDQFFVVDHCHKTDQIRGLLCHPCNAALGLLKDNVNSLKSAISYLSRYA